MSKYAFVGGKLVDGTGAAPVEDSLVLIDDDKITYAGPRKEVPEGYEVRDASGHTVMPGLVDTHLHFSGNLTDNDNDWVIESVAQKQACAVKQAYDALTHGLTTVVEIGRNGIAIRDLVNMGIMQGPRIFATGLGLCRVAGHGDSHHLPLQISKDGHPWGDQVDGPWELRKAIRRRLREEPDGIKIWATGGGIWRWDSDRLQLFCTEEIKAIADECALVGIPLYAHSYNNFDAAYDCVRFGCKQLIHGFELDERTMKLMAEQGTYFTPTIGFLPTWYGTYPPDWTPELTHSQARLLSRRALHAPTLTCVRLMTWVSPLPSALTPSALSLLTATSPLMRCMTLSRRLASPSWILLQLLLTTVQRCWARRTSLVLSRKASPLISS